MTDSEKIINEAKKQAELIQEHCVTSIERITKSVKQELEDSLMANLSDCFERLLELKSRLIAKEILKFFETENHTQDDRYFVVLNELRKKYGVEI